MKRLITASFLLLVLVALPLSHLLMADSRAPRLTAVLCHNGHVIHVNAHAAAAHAAHDDCGAPVLPPGSPCDCTPPMPQC